MAAIIVLLLVGGVVALRDAVQERFNDNAECAAKAYDDVGC
jgi:Flp pilus assembly pilin Flp